MRFLPVNIYHNGEVDNEVVNVSKSERDVVVWQNPHHYDFTIHFTKNPFEAGPTFCVPAQGTISSGPLKSSALPEEAFDYDIKNEKMQLAGDPGIVIKP